jgi:uncharacterized protein with ParB-like and HNH nuclease domain
MINSHQKELAETAIREAKKTVDYNTVEYPLENFLDKVKQEQIDNNLHWDRAQQSYFIESLLLGLPVLNVVINNGDELDVINDEVEIIDGKQRLYTAINFINGNLKLKNLKAIESLNDFNFNDLVPSRQRNFKRITVRAIAVRPDFDISVLHLR